MDDRVAYHVYFTPLVISAAGIIGSTLAIAAYHFSLFRYCLRPQRIGGRNNRRSPEQGQNKSDGAQEEILQQIPIVCYSTQKGDTFRLDQNECVICLGELEDGELVRLLPNCKHAFHSPCIDEWFTKHLDCPFCRSPIITCDSETEAPTASETVGEPSHVPEIRSDDHRLMGDDLSASTSNLRFQQTPRGLLRHSASVKSHMEKKPRALGIGLKRSWSLDQSSLYIAISIRREEEKASSSSSSSSSTKGFVMSHYNLKARSLRHLDHMSLVLMEALSQFRYSRSGRLNGILPN